MVDAVSTHLKMLNRVHSKDCILDSLQDSCQPVPFNFGSFLQLISAHTCHHTICSLNDAHLHSSISYANNVSIAQEMIDFHTGNQSPFVDFHFSCMCQLSWGCIVLHYSFNFLDYSYLLRDHDPEFMASWKLHYCIYCHYRVCNYKEANRVTIAIYRHFSLANYYY